MPFALAVAPIAMLTVAAIDFNRGTNARTSLQDSLDAAALVVGRSMVTDPAEVQSLGASALAANLKLPPDTDLVSSEFILSGTEVHAKAKSKVKPLVTEMFAGDKLNVSVRTHVRRGGDQLEIALVLDNTYSMVGSKLDLLKTAANNFVDKLQVAANQSLDPDPVKIALVPFSMTVNVGSTYQNATWIDQAGVSPLNNEPFNAPVNRFTLFANMGKTWGGCVESRQSPYDVQETAPTAGTPATLFTPYFAVDEPDSRNKSNYQNGNFGTFYNDYLVDGVYSTSDWKIPQGAVAKYTGGVPTTGTNNTTHYQYGPNAGCHLQPVVRLTTNLASVKTGITAMTAIGDTNVPMGLVWGWHALSPIGPFSDGSAYGAAKKKKIVVLMTDGQNSNAPNGNSNQSYYSGVGYIRHNRLGVGLGSSSAQRQAALDARLATLCQNMKAAGKDIIIYTVRVEVNDQNFGTLKNCASSPAKFYDVQNASELNGVFQQIADSIQNLRLAK